MVRYTTSTSSSRGTIGTRGFGRLAIYVSSMVYTSSTTDYPSLAIDGDSFAMGNLYERPTGPYSYGTSVSVSLQTIATVAKVIFTYKVLRTHGDFAGSGPLVTNVYVSIDGASGARMQDYSVGSSGYSRRATSVPYYFGVTTIGLG